MGGLVVLSMIMGSGAGPPTSRHPDSSHSPSRRCASRRPTTQVLDQLPSHGGRRPRLCDEERGEGLGVSDHVSTRLRGLPSSLWTSNSRKASFGYGRPGAGEGMVFARSTEDGWSAIHRLAARNVCPTWIARPGGDLTAAAPVVADGRVYVGSDDGTFSAYPVRCSSYPQPCPALWTACHAGRLRARGLGGRPARGRRRRGVRRVDGRFVVRVPHVVPRHLRAIRRSGSVWAAREPARPLRRHPLCDGGQDLDAIPTRCLATGASCGPRWIGRATSLIVSMPQIDDGNVFVGSTDGTVSCSRSRVVVAGGCASPRGRSRDSDACRIPRS